MSEKNFADGIRVSRRDNAPEFVVCQLGVHVDKFIAWAKQHENQAGFVNVDVKRSKNGNLYAELNAWKPEMSMAETRRNEARSQQSGGPNLPQEDFSDDIPFARCEF